MTVTPNIDVPQPVELNNTVVSFVPETTTARLVMSATKAFVLYDLVKANKVPDAPMTCAISMTIKLARVYRFVQLETHRILHALRAVKRFPVNHAMFGGLAEL